jgi:hypothetical protein
MACGKVYPPKHNACVEEKRRWDPRENQVRVACFGSENLSEICQRKSMPHTEQERERGKKLAGEATSAPEGDE